VAPAVPLRGLASDARYVAGVARRFDGPVLLVGHGYGGAVASVAGAEAENVTGLVFVAGFVLELGQSMVDAATGFRSMAVGSALRPVEFRTPDGGAAIELYLDVEAYGRVFAADLPGPVAAAMAAAQRPIATAALEEPAAAAAWQTLPARYLVTTADEMLHPDVQRAMAARAGCATTVVASSHAVALAHPAAVTGVIRDITG
jgi:pimeloyl-ACP methyl ester carboxylesterase